MKYICKCHILCFSAKRKEEFKEFCIFTDIDFLTILKHCSTRWLSLQRSVARTLELWPALKSYFLSHKESDKPGRVQKVAEYFASEEMHMYFMLLDYVLPSLNEFNTAFQVYIFALLHLLFLLSACQ